MLGLIRSMIKRFFMKIKSFIKRFFMKIKSFILDLVVEIRSMGRGNISNVISFILIIFHFFLILSVFIVPYIANKVKGVIYSIVLKKNTPPVVYPENVFLDTSFFTFNFNVIYGRFFLIVDGIVEFLYKYVYVYIHSNISKPMNSILEWVGSSYIFFLDGQFNKVIIHSCHEQVNDQGVCNISVLLDDLLSLLFLSLVFVVFTSVWLYAYWFNVSLFEVNIYVIIEVLSLLVFLSKTLLTLVILMEISTILLLFVFIGTRARRVRAMSMLFVYTFISGSCLLILYIYCKIGVFDNFCVFVVGLVGFFIKLPVFPFHYWLPEAHSECTTCGSVILAGVILKIGYYGFLKYMLPFVVEFNGVVRGCLIGFLMLSTLYIFGAVMMQVDVKKIIAYSSVIHMQVATAMLFFIDDVALISSLFLVFNHAFVSSSLFFLASLYINVEGTRDVIKWRGSKRQLSGFLIVLLLCNIGFPFTIGFYGELMAVLVCSNTAFIIILLLLFSQVISVTYNLRLYWLIVANDGPYYNIKIKMATYVTPVVFLMVFNVAFFLFFSYFDVFFFMENYIKFKPELREADVLLGLDDVLLFGAEVCKSDMFQQRPQITLYDEGVFGARMKRGTQRFVVHKTV